MTGNNLENKAGKRAARFRVKDIALISLGASFIAVCAWITIPAAVPFTAQTFGLFLVLKTLGGVRGTAAVSLYIALGAAGIPVFSGFNAGIGTLAGPTGGYIAGFLVCSLVYCLFPGRSSPAAEAAVCVSGLTACYALGTLWFSFRTGTGTAQSFLLCTAPFIIPDLAKLFLATLAARRLEKINLKHRRT